jgi:PKD repeat protein
LGSKVNFTDLSSNFPTEWHWTFEGGDPNTSTDRNPIVQYNTAGNFKVSLWAKNSLGPSDTLTLNNYIIVSSQGLCNNFNNFVPAYTASILKLSQFGNYTGYLTGHNSEKSSGISEFFSNACGYKFVSGINIRFAHVYSTSEDATITVILWNDRGPQHAPGSVIERKVVLLKQIQEDLASNRPTTIVFDRESPVLSRPFQVGVELTYTSGDSIAIQSSADGEATNASSWIRNEAGTWKPYTIAFGANIAMNIEPIVGMDPSVQVSASKLLIYPGQEVVLNGHGASIFVWNADDGSVQNVAGPQLIAHPTATTTFMTVGSGLKLCNDTTYTTIYVRENVTGLEPDPIVAGINLFPNPGTAQLNVVIENGVRGTVAIHVLSIFGIEAAPSVVSTKSDDRLIKTFDTSTLRPGIYLVMVKLGERSVVKKWVKY